MDVRLSWLAAAATVAALGAQQPSAPQAPDATFTGVKGPVSLQDYRGKQAVVLLFMRGYGKGFACYYCGEQTREYLAKYGELKAAGAEVLMVLPHADDIAGYVKKIGEGCTPPQPALALPFPVVLDKGGKACAAFEVPTKEPGGSEPFWVEKPATIVIDRTGAVVFAHHGDDPSDRTPVADVLAVLKGKAAPVAKKTAVPSGPARAWVAYEDGLRAAKQAKKPILLEFHAVW